MIEYHNTDPKPIIISQGRTINIVLTNIPKNTTDIITIQIIYKFHIYEKDVTNTFLQNNFKWYCNDSSLAYWKIHPRVSTSNMGKFLGYNNKYTIAKDSINILRFSYNGNIKEWKSSIIVSGRGSSILKLSCNKIEIDWRDLIDISNDNSDQIIENLICTSNNNIDQTSKNFINTSHNNYTKSTNSIEISNDNLEDKPSNMDNCNKIISELTDIIFSVTTNNKNITETTKQDKDKTLEKYISYNDTNQNNSVSVGWADTNKSYINDCINLPNNKNQPQNFNNNNIKQQNNPIIKEVINKIYKSTGKTVESANFGIPFSFWISENDSLTGQFKITKMKFDNNFYLPICKPILLHATYKFNTSSIIIITDTKQQLYYSKSLEIDNLNRIKCEFIIPINCNYIKIILRFKLYECDDLYLVGFSVPCGSINRCNNIIKDDTIYPIQ